MNKGFIYMRWELEVCSSLMPDLYAECFQIFISFCTHNYKLICFLFFIVVQVEWIAFLEVQYFFLKFCLLGLGIVMTFLLRYLIIRQYFS